MIVTSIYLIKNYLRVICQITFYFLCCLLLLLFPTLFCAYLKSRVCIIFSNDLHWLISKSLFNNFFNMVMRLVHWSSMNSLLLLECIKSDCFLTSFNLLMVFWRLLKLRRVFSLRFRFHLLLLIYDVGLLNLLRWAWIHLHWRSKHRRSPSLKSRAHHWITWRSHPHLRSRASCHHLSNYRWSWASHYWDLLLLLGRWCLSDSCLSLNIIVFDKC